MIDKTYIEANISSWWRDRGDDTHRINYDLTDKSVIMDLGGFKGDWTNIMINKYNCKSHIFEPVESLVNKIASRFAGDKRVRVYDVAVGNKRSECKMYHGADETSLFSLGDSNNFETIKMLEVGDVLDKLKLDFVDLVKINIEGGEFDLLDTIINNNLQSKFGNIQVQFHKVENDSVERREKIREGLSKTHTCTWEYPWVWENWKLK